ncbi:alpha/beta hydrolase [Pelomonas sp. SE-A7]|uniref:alpha/beta fold hydrolase n=1 Tax=Pelomonas sp. SE-A7 TaxID=3054953 RepID=UPI00259CB691|nr:alpha/beta hydrolase [Pelomonas sp. SE-A7]MDM4765577.1 alpha/beta hydrolase [Pelomonas sp. SE-A7]
MSRDWILLRGLSREAGHWGGFPERLLDQLPAGSRVHRLDLPGNGRWHQLESPTRIAKITEHARTQLAELALPAPPLLVGLSLGGMVAVDWAARHPRELAGVALVSSSLAGHSPWWLRLRQTALPLMLAALAWPSVRWRERCVFELTSSQPRPPPGLIEAWCELRRRHPVTALNFARQLRAASGYRAPQACPGLPLILLAGEQDRLVSPECSRRTAECWQMPLRLHPQAGHDLPLDAPLWLAKELAAWSSALP